MLRHVGERHATIWVETDQSSHVVVECGSAEGSSDTFAVAGHHYAVIVIRGLVPGSAAPYEVHLDGQTVWPDPAAARPPSLIRTLAPDRPVRLLFGSCRSPHTVVVRDPTGSGEDELIAYARELQALPSDEVPDALLMLGDQVYADETSDESVQAFARHRDVRKPPYGQAANFEEYTQLYREAWGQADIRWLLATVPSSMIFDDHDVIDDWNTSASWRADMARKPWWHERIVAALSSYWVYQHLGNLSPDELALDDLYQRVRGQGDAHLLLRGFAERADAEADGAPPTRWSYRRDFGRTRVLVIDSRAGRVLTDADRAMVGDDEFAWMEAQLADADFDHLVIATSVPWLLPRALHDLEACDEALAGNVRGRAIGWIAERLRRAVDLEHWAAFRASFDRLAQLIADVGSGIDRPAPASITVLSGDVHHAYASEATFPGSMQSRVYQLTCSPFHNFIPLPMRLVFLASWSRRAARIGRWLARFRACPTWRSTGRPSPGRTSATTSRFCASTGGPRPSPCASRRSWTVRPGRCPSPRPTGSSPSRRPSRTRRP